VEDSFTAPNGHQVQAGPALDVFPTISADNNTIQLTVNAELSLKRPERFPDEKLQTKTE
jgi:hypothetical protein